MTLCTSSPHPSTWVHVYYGRSTGCPNYTATTFNTVRAKLPTEGERVCTSVLPAGWRWESYGRSTLCPNYSSTGTNTAIIRPL